MRYTLLFCMIVLNIGKLKTETIDFAQKNGRIESMFPISQSNLNAMVSDYESKSFEGKDKEHNWDDLDFRPNSQVLQKSLNSYVDEDYDYESQKNDLPEYQFKSIDQLDEAEAVRLSKHLMKALDRPEIFDAPLIIVNNEPNNSEDASSPSKFDQGISKRARLYMQYPWKRHNTRTYTNVEYDPYNLCSPSRRDVFRLLTALHDIRQGNKLRAVRFCNLRRPANSVYTNIRYLGRKRK